MVADVTPTCPQLTRVIGEVETGHLSQINTKDVGTIWDNEEGVTEPVSLNSETPVNCEVTVREQAENGTKTQQTFYARPRPTATDLRTNPELLAIVEQGRKQYAKGSKESREERAAHLLRNDESNPRHNPRNSLKRAINKIYHHPVLFDVSGTLRLNSEQRGRLNHTDLSGTRND